MSDTKGDYPISSSEAEYRAHIGLIDMALPLNGGTLQADGTWLQTEAAAGEWPESLPGLAQTAGQRYVPTVGDNRDQILALLDDPAAQQVAADGLPPLATTRFDAPWDGVCVNLEGMASDYQEKLSAFLTLLSEHVGAAGLPFCVAMRGRTSDTGLDYDDAYTHDFAVIGAISDLVLIYCYNYWQPEPRSVCPLWWVRSCIEYALSKGIAAQNLYLGLALAASYWPITGLVTRYEITHAQSMQIISDAGAAVEWVESNGNGLVREWYSDVGDGHIWFQDGATIGPRLALVDEYNLAGVSLFAPGMGDESVWQAIADWKRPASTTTRSMNAQRLHGCGGIFATY